MAIPAFQRMHERLIARLGDQAVLRGNVPCTVNIEYGITVDYEIGDDKFQRSEYAATVDIANILKQHNPTPGDALVMALYSDAPGTATGKAYVIDALAGDNGFMVRCVLRSA